MDTTYNVRIKIDNSGNSSVSKLKNSFSSMGDSTNEITQSMESLKKQLTGIAGINLIPVVKPFEKINIKPWIEDSKKYLASLKNMKSALKELYGNNGTYKLFLEAKKSVEEFGEDNSYYKLWKYYFEESESNFEESKAQLNEIAYDFGKQTAGVIKQIGKQFKETIVSTLKWVIGLSTVALIGLTRMSIKVASNGDTIKDNAEKVSMSTRQYQEWSYVLEQTGTDISTFNTLMSQFSKNFANNQDVFKQYGIEANTVSEAFEQAIDKIRGLNTEGEKLKALTTIFGARTGTQLLPIVNMSAEDVDRLRRTYTLLGATMSGSLISASDTLTDSITELKAAWTGLKNTLAEKFMPVIKQVVNWLTLAVGVVTLFTRTFFGINDAAGDAAVKTSDMANSLSSAAGSASELKRTIAGFDELEVLNGDTGGTSAISGLSDELSSFGDGIDGLITDDTLGKLEDFKEKLDNIKTAMNFDGSEESIRTVVKSLAALALEALGAFMIFSGALTGNYVSVGIGMGILGYGYNLGSDTPLWKVTGIDEVVHTLIGWSLEAAGACMMLKGSFSGNWGVVVVGAGLCMLGNHIKNQNFNENWTLGKGIDNAISALKRKAIIGAGIATGFKLLLAGNYVGALAAWGAVGVYAAVSGTNSGSQSVKLNNGTTYTPGLTNGGTLLQNTNGVKEVAEDLAEALKKEERLKKLTGFASGGVLTMPTYGLMAEYPGARSNPEVVAPQSVIAETINASNGQLASVFTQVGRQIITAIDNKDMNVSIGDETIAKSAARGSSAYYKRTGTQLVGV